MSSHQQRRNELHDRMTVGQKIADKVASTMGGWPFIIVQSTILACWIILNAAELIFRPWDPYPFILLNLMLSFQAAYAAPFIMMSQNRQAAKDRSRDDLEAEEVEQLQVRPPISTESRWSRRILCSTSTRSPIISDVCFPHRRRRVWMAESARRRHPDLWCQLLDYLVDGNISVCRFIAGDIRL